MTAEEEIEKLFAEHKPLTRLRHIPTEAIRRLHERFQLGVANYGEKSWNANNNPAALTDLQFIADRIEHAKAHIAHLQMEFARGVETGKFEFTDDDPAAIMWFGTFTACAQTALRKLQEEKTCQTCGGSGGVDSGGFTPWGSPIDVPCPDCSKDVIDYPPLLVSPGFEFPETATRPQCVDMLSRDVVAGDVMWDTADRELHPHHADSIFTQYRHSIRCPRPGEPIPGFEGWRDMCLAMQESGAKFVWLNGAGEWSKPHQTGSFSFSESVTRFRRDEGCTWKGPQ